MKVCYECWCFSIHGTYTLMSLMFENVPSFSEVMGQMFPHFWILGKTLPPSTLHHKVIKAAQSSQTCLFYTRNNNSLHLTILQCQQNLKHLKEQRCVSKYSSFTMVIPLQNVLVFSRLYGIEYIRKRSVERFECQFSKHLNSVSQFTML